MKKKLTFLLMMLLPIVAAWGDSITLNGIIYDFDTNPGYATVAGAEESMTSIEVPGDITFNGKNYVVSFVKDYAFYNNINLREVSFKGTKTLGCGCFEGCSNLKLVELGPGADLRIDGSYAFYNCSSLQSISFVHKVNGVYFLVMNSPKSTFEGCSSLTSIQLASNNPRIFDNTFKNCTSLTSITVNAMCYSIGSEAFRGCTSLNTVVLQGPMEGGISTQAFANCTQLKDFYVNKLEYSLLWWHVSDDAFKGTNLSKATLHVSADQLSDAKETAPWNNFGIIKVELTDTDVITFKDANVKAICIQNWDTNGDGELSFGEAKAVTSIGTVFGNNKQIKLFDEFQYFTGITELQSYSFSDCLNLESISLPESLTRMSDFEFKDDKKLKNIYIPKSLTEMAGYGIFQGCTGLQKAEFESIESLCNTWFNGLSNPLELAHHLYINGEEVFDVVIPNTVTKIRTGAFNGGSNLRSISIPNSVKEIEQHAFYGCTGLTSLALPNSLIVIETEAFSGCTGLESITIPSSVTTISKPGWSHPFNGCTGLKEINVEGSNANFVSIDGVLFDKNKTIIICYPAGKAGSSYTIPNSVNTIGNDCFQGCSPLNAISIPASVSTIEDEAFGDCTNLKDITLPSSVTSIGAYSFWGCKSLTSIVIPERNTVIADRLFYKCSGLVSVSIPNSVTAIKYAAFSGCSNLASLTIPAGVTEIGNYAFDGCKNMTSLISLIEEPFDSKSLVFKGISSTATLRVPVGTIEKYKAKAGWKDFVNIEEIDGGESTYKDGDTFKTKTTEGVEMTFKVISVRDKTCQVGDDDNPAIDMFTNGVVTVPEEVEGFRVVAIGISAFAQCWCLTGLNLSDEIRSIGAGGIYGCSNLTQLTLPANLKSIGQQGLGATGLTELYIPASLSEIGISAFCYNYNLTKITVAAENPAFASPDGSNVIIRKADNTLIAACQTSVIPQDIKGIGRSAFSSWVDLQSITIPASVTSMERYAFSNCRALKDITILVEEPFDITDDVFNAEVYTSAILTVPAGTKDKYQAAKGWKNFSTIVEIEEEQQPQEIGDTFTAQTKEGVEMTFMVTNLDPMECQVGTGEESSISESTSGHVTIPETAKDYKVTAIGAKGFYECSQMTHCWLTENIESIGDLAFYGCTSLVTLDLPRSVTYISESAFRNCGNASGGVCINVSADRTDILPSFSGTMVIKSPTQEIIQDLERVFIPKPLTSLGERLFSNCKSVVKMEVEDGHEVYNDGDGSNAIIRTADNTLLYGCQNTVIPETVTAIGAYAFEGHSGLEQIVIPAEVNSIGEMAFSGCVNLKKVETYVKEPFAIDNNTFSQATYDYATLYVPYGAASTYRETEGWKNFYDIEEMREGDIITLTANNYSRVYGGENPEFEFSLTGGTIVSGAPAITCEATAMSPVGTYDIVIARNTVGNSDVTLVNGKLTITKAPLTIKAGTYTRKQGEENPEFTLTYEGFKNGETEAVLTKLPTVKTMAEKESASGEYDITISGAEAENYDITYANGTLIVTDADPVTLTALSYTREYGEANPMFEFTSEGATLEGQPEISCEATATSPVGTYDIIIKKGSVANYNDTYVNGTLTITKAPLTISADSYTITEGDELPEFTLTYEGFKNGEDEDVLNVKPHVTCSATTDSKAGEYAISISGAEAENYELAYVDGKLTIKAKPVTIDDLLPEENSDGSGGSDFGSGDSVINENTDLNEKVVGSIYYCITPGDGGYNAEEGCLVINKASTGESTQTSGDDYELPSVETGFRGLVFFVQAGRGKVKIKAETTGRLLLCVKIADELMLSMSVEGKTTLTIPYEVSEASLVFVYAGTAAGARHYEVDGTDDALKIYSVEWKPEPTGISNVNEDNDDTFDVYDVKGCKVRSQVKTLKGLKKGVYIVGGKKVAIK